MNYHINGIRRCVAKVRQNIDTEFNLKSIESYCCHIQAELDEYKDDLNNLINKINK